MGNPRGRNLNNLIDRMSLSNESVSDWRYTLVCVGIKDIPNERRDVSSSLRSRADKFSTGGFIVGIFGACPDRSSLTHFLPCSKFDCLSRKMNSTRLR